MALTDTTAARIAGFNSTDRDALLADLGPSEVVTSGALNLNKPIHELSVTGTQAYTLAAGTTTGQRKRIICTVAASIPVGTLTITSPEDTAGIVCPTTFIFDTVGQSVELVWTGTKWRCARTQRAGAKTAVVGTTALTGFNLCHQLLLSVTGTVSSTGANAIPNGAYPGDRLIVGQSVAASIPVGNINFTGFTLAGVAATDLQAWGALTDTVTLEWRGTGWVVAANSGVTVA
jgi:hypothetical protein